MCLGGKNTSKKATEAAETEEAERQRQIQQSISGINAAFGSPDRQRQRDEFVTATRQLLEGQATRQKQAADRDAKFALARSGLTLGSADADTAANLQRSFQDALLESERRAQGAGADLRNADEQSRLNLIALAQSGLDSTTANEQALAQLQANIGAQRALTNQQTLGNVFADSAQLFRDVLEEQRARREINRTQPGNLFQPVGNGLGAFRSPAIAFPGFGG